MEKGVSGGRKGTKDRGRVFVLEQDKGLPLDREKTDMAHRQMAIYKGKRRNLVLG